MNESDQATQRDLQILDTILSSGLNLLTCDYRGWLAVTTKVIDIIPIAEVQTLLRQFVEQTSIFHALGKVVDDGNYPRLRAEYTPAQHVGFSYATTHAEFSIELELTAIIAALASQ